MRGSLTEPRPVPVRAYRYSKLRWRVLVRILDAIGAALVWLWRLVRSCPRVSQPRRILIVQLDHMGDALLTSPLFPRLKAAYPEARIDVLASPTSEPVFAANPHVDGVLVAHQNWFERRQGGWASWSAVWSLGRTLRRGDYDLGIDVRGDVLAVFVLALAGIPRRVGWAMGGGAFLLTDVARWQPGRHEVLSRLALLNSLGVDTPGPARVEAHPGAADHASIARRLQRSWPVANPPDSEPLLLVVHPGAGTAAKRWPIASWNRLIQQFLDTGWRVVVVGGDEDRARGAQLVPHPALRDWTGALAVTETAALLERADLFLGADSGPAHLAACAGTASVVLFSGTNQPSQWRPWSRRCLVVRGKVACSPCHRKVCPLADHPCLSQIDPDGVFHTALRWWLRLREPSGSEASHGLPLAAGSSAATRRIAPAHPRGKTA